MAKAKMDKEDNSTIILTILVIVFYTMTLGSMFWVAIQPGQDATLQILPWLSGFITLIHGFVVVKFLFLSESSLDTTKKQV